MGIISCSWVRYRAAVIGCCYLLAGCSQSETPDDIVFSDLQLRVIDQFESDTTSFEGFLTSPLSCDFSDDGRLFVIDAREHHIVVFDESYKAVATIGREGDGPGKFRFLRPSSNTNRIDIRGDLLVVDTKYLIHLFRTNGEFVTRIQPNDRIEDLAITADGNIVAFSNNPTHPFTSFNQSGEEIGRFGESFVKADTLVRFDERRSLRTRTRNLCEIEALSDGRLVSIGLYWPRLKVYSENIIVSEVTIHFSQLYPDASTELRKTMTILDDRWTDFPPEMFDELVFADRLTDSHLTGPGRLLFRFNVEGSILWGAMGNQVFQLNDKGEILKVFDIGGFRPWDLAIHKDGRVVICFTKGDQVGLAVGRLPDIDGLH